MIRKTVLLAALALLLLFPMVAAAGDDATDQPLATATDAISAVLDDFHRAATDADEERYLGHMAPSGVFLGTDASERWPKEAFREFVHPYFSQGKGWTFEPVKRYLSLSTDGTAAWFDEHLESDSYGTCRGSGALQLIDGVWKIEQYNLTLPVPNELIADLVERIRATE